MTRKQSPVPSWNKNHSFIRSFARSFVHFSPKLCTVSKSPTHSTLLHPTPLSPTSTTRPHPPNPTTTTTTTTTSRRCCGQLINYRHCPRPRRRPCPPCRRTCSSERWLVPARCTRWPRSAPHVTVTSPATYPCRRHTTPRDRSSPGLQRDVTLVSPARHCM